MIQKTSDKMEFSAFKGVIPHTEFDGLIMMKGKEIRQDMVDIQRHGYLLGEESFCETHQNKLFKLVKTLVITESSVPSSCSIILMSFHDNNIVNHFVGEQGCEDIISRVAKNTTTYKYDKNIFEQIEYITKLQNA